jgi:S-adenosylmethionine hydrolase
MNSTFDSFAAVYAAFALGIAVDHFAINPAPHLVTKFAVGEKHSINGAHVMEITKIDEFHDLTILIPNDESIKTGDTLCLVK